MTNSVERILAVTDMMASVQAASPGEKDATGFSNADFPLGMVLSVTGDVEKSAALLWLYTGQAEGHGILKADLLEHLPEDFDGSRASARTILNDARTNLEGKLGFVATESGVIFNGVRLGLETTRSLKRLGATRTSTGWLLANSRVQEATRVLGATILHAEALESIIESCPQMVIPTGSLPEKQKNGITFTVSENTVSWTYSSANPLFGQIKDIVKSIGARYNGAGGWEMKPENLSVLALTMLDLNLDKVDTSALEPFVTSDPEIQALKEEIATNSLRVKLTKVGENKVKLSIRKYQENFISVCRNAQGRYDGAGGWVVDQTSIPAIAASLATNPQFDTSALDAFLPSEADLEHRLASDSAIPTKTPTGFSLFPHQVDDVAFLIKPAADAKGCSKLLGNDMGTGKTLSSLVAANFKCPTGRFLVVVPAVAKLNWAKEIKKWIGAEEKIQVVVGRSATLDPAARWTIINYDIISYYKDALMSAKFDIAILDECHQIKTYSTQRAAALIPTFNRTTQTMDKAILSNIPNVWTMTGTFIMNRMKELFTTLRAVDHRLGRSKRQFEERYCGGESRYVGHGRTVWMANGASNLPELASKLAPIYRKVMKVDVLKDLPNKMRDDFQVEVSNKDLMEIRRLERAIELALEGADEEDEAPCILPYITEMKIATARMKVEATLAEADAVVDAGNKVIIFTEYTDVLQSILEHFGEKAVYIDGSITGAKREASVEAFQDNPEIRVLVGNIKACGVAITLTAASHVIFNDKPWNPALAAQAEDRAYRIGQTKSVNIIYMTAPGTYDEQLSAKLLEKSTLVTNWESMTEAEVQALNPRSEMEEIITYIRSKRVGLPIYSHRI